MPQHDGKSLENKLIDLQYLKAERSVNDQLLKNISQLSDLDSRLQSNQLEQEQGLSQLGYLNQSLNLKNLGFNLQQDQNSLRRDQSLFNIDRQNAFSRLQSSFNLDQLSNQSDQLGVQRDETISGINDQIDIGKLSLSSLRTRKSSLRKSTNLALRQIASQVETLNKGKDLAARSTSLKTRISYLQSESLDNAVEQTRYFRDLNINRNLRKRRAASGLLTAGVLQKGFDLEGVSDQARFKLKDLSLEARKVEFTRQAIFNEYSTSLLRSDRQIKDLGFKKQNVELNFKTQNKIFGNAIKSQKISLESLNRKLDFTEKIFSLKQDSIDLNIQNVVDRRSLEEGFSKISKNFILSSNLLSNASIGLSRQGAKFDFDQKRSGLGFDLKRVDLQRAELLKKKRQNKVFKKSLTTLNQKIRRDRLKNRGIAGI